MASAAGSSLVSVISSCTRSFRLASTFFASSIACRCRSPSDACHSAIDELSAFINDNTSLSPSTRTDRACLLFSLSLPCTDLSPPRRPLARPRFRIPRIQPRGSSSFHSPNGIQGLAPTFVGESPPHPPRSLPPTSGILIHHNPLLPYLGSFNSLASHSLDNAYGSYLLVHYGTKQ